jgi:protein arginine kinase activator
VDKKAKCDQCEAKAIITEVVVKNGEKVEQKLCEKCAASAGIAIQLHSQAAQALSQFALSQGIPAPKPPGQTPCPACGLLFAQFRKEHHLGCPDCYAAFEEELGPLIERAHEGGTHHVGKLPRSRAGSGDRLRRAAALRKQLNQAIEAEQFEKAAVIRDQIRRLEAGETPATDPHRADTGIREA